MSAWCGAGAFVCISERYKLPQPHLRTRPSRDPQLAAIRAIPSPFVQPHRRFGFFHSFRDNQSENFSCLMAPAGPWELAFCVGVGASFSRVSAKKIWIFFCVFGGVFGFLVVISHFEGVISRFGGCFRATRPLFRAQREKSWLFSPRGREQNLKYVKFPLWGQLAQAEQRGRACDTPGRGLFFLE